MLKKTRKKHTEAPPGQAERRGVSVCFPYLDTNAITSFYEMALLPEKSGKNASLFIIYLQFTHFYHMGFLKAYKFNKINT